MWEEKLKIYDQIVAKCTRFERKGKTMPYTSANGYMFTLYNKACEIGIRFSKERQEQFIKEHDTTIYKSYGAVMRGYVLIPESMWKDQDQVAAYMEESFDYVSSLPPNKSKKK